MAIGRSTPAPHAGSVSFVFPFFRKSDTGRPRPSRRRAWVISFLSSFFKLATDPPGLARHPRPPKTVVRDRPDPDLAWPSGTRRSGIEALRKRRKKRTNRTLQAVPRWDPSTGSPRKKRKKRTIEVSFPIPVEGPDDRRRTKTGTATLHASKVTSLLSASSREGISRTLWSTTPTRAK